MVLGHPQPGKVRGVVERICEGAGGLPSTYAGEGPRGAGPDGLVRVAEERRQVGYGLRAAEVPEVPAALALRQRWRVA